jgi:hypothetical protein
MSLLKNTDREVLIKAAAAVRELPCVKLKPDLASPEIRAPASPLSRSRPGRTRRGRTRE